MTTRPASKSPTGPQISVIIPTFNRAPILEMTLRALCEQQAGALPPFEVIVINDGSTDQTATLLDRLVKRYGSRLAAVHQANKRQAIARNRGLRLAHGRLLVFLGDDIIPDEGFLHAHWSRFVAEGRPRRYAAIGRISWHSRVKPSPFRTWINDWGLQFGFRLISDPEHVPFNFFYTANAAFSRDLYDEFGGFNERFRGYGWEDIELGYRYQTLGDLRLRYLSNALAYHYHRITVTAFCRRQLYTGYAAMFFYDLYPQLREFLQMRSVPGSLRFLKPCLYVAARLIQLGDERLGLDLNRFTDGVLHQYYNLGMLRGQRDLQVRHGPDGLQDSEVMMAVDAVDGPLAK